MPKLVSKSKLPLFLEKVEAVTGYKPRHKGNGSYMALCPAHDDHNPSLAITEAKDGGIHPKCFAGCTKNEILEELGLSIADLGSPSKAKRGKKKIVATYDYRDAEGNFLHQKVRYWPKDFRQRRPNGNGSWTYDLKGVKHVPYRLPELTAATKAGRRVYIVEGEKDVENLAKLGLDATTWPGGATKGRPTNKWKPEFNELFRGADVVISPDNDDPGRTMAFHIAAQLHPVAAEVKVIELPGLPPKGDVSDWLANGGTPKRLKELVEEAPVFNPEEGTEDVPQLTELATARRLLKHHGENLRHHTGLGWCFYDGQRWLRSKKAAQRCTHNMGRVIRAELTTLDTKDAGTAKSYYKHALTCEKSQTINSILEIAQALDGIDADDIEWDAHPWLLNCPNGTLDLRTGKLQPHSREDYITKLCPTPYDPKAKCGRWRRYLKEVTNGDADLVNYLQWVLGYSLTGCTDYDIFFVLHGAGDNGKTTCIRIVQHVLGEDYAQQINPEELMFQKYARHSTELAQLRGARFVAAVESTEGRRLNEALIKGLTGGDKVRARFMRQDSFEFVPELKLFLSTNHKPAIADTSAAMWRRVRLIPFEASFPKDDPRRDEQLEAKLQDEAAGILAWAVKGAGQVLNGEPELPERVQIATDTYRAEEDVVAQFLEEECELYEGASVLKGTLYRAYRRWSNGRCEGQKAFSARIKDKGFSETRLHGGTRAWSGIEWKYKELGEEGDAW